MGLKSCSLYGRCRDRNTGKLTKISELHRDLVGLGKILTSFSRLKANKAFYLSQSPKFLDMYSEDMVFTSEDADAEPKLASFFETAHNIMPEVTYNDIRDLLAKKFKEGVYSYKTAYSKMLSFNSLMDGGTSFIGTLVPQEDGQYMFKIVPNTPLELESLVLVIADRQNVEDIITRLRNLGIDIAEGLTALYGKDNPRTIALGLLGIITLRNGKEAAAYNIKDLADMTGHVIIGMTGRGNKLYDRLYEAVAKNELVAKELLGEEDYLQCSAITDFDERIEYIMSKLVGLYVELWGDIVPTKGSNLLGKLVQRLVDWVVARFRFTDRDYYASKYNAKWNAYNLAKSFMGPNFIGMSALKTLNKSPNKIESHLQTSLLKLHEALESVKDFGYNAHKNYNDTFHYLMTLFHEINLLRWESKTIEDLRNIERASAQSIIRLVNFITNEIQLTKVLLEASLRGLDGNGNPVSMAQQAKVIKYCQQVLNMATQTLEYAKDFNYIEDEDLKVKIQRVFAALSKVTTSYSTRHTASGQEEEAIESSYQLMIDEARRKLALKLLVLINGNSFIAISQHVHFQAEKLFSKERHMELAREAARARSIEDVLSENVTSTFVSRWIDSLADNPDIVNLVIYDAIELKKHEANVKTLDIKDRLFDLYKDLKRLGVSDTRMFYEKDSLGHLTGNFISERNWGEWERLYKKEKKEFEDRWYNTTGVSLKIPRSEMYSNTQFLMAFGGWREGWHNDHSVKIELKDDEGNPITYEDGKPKRRLVPVISTDEGADSKPITFDNPLWEKLKENESLYNWFKEYMSLKKELDSLLPDGCTNALGVRAPQFMGTATDRLKNAFKGDGKLKRVVGMSMRKYLIHNIAANPSDTEYGGENNTYDQDDLYSEDTLIFSRAHQNAIKSLERVPLYGVKKLPHTDDLSTDLIHSTLAYAAMAYSYNCLDEVAEVATLIAETRRDITEKKSFIPSIFLSTKAHTYERLVDYLQLQVYNNYIDPHLPDGTTPTSRKLSGMISRIGSVWMLGWNMHSALTNAFTGFNELWKEACAGEDFNKTDFGWACLLYIRYWAIGFLERMCNIAVKDGSIIEATTKMHLFSRLYDILNENERRFRDYHVLTKGWDFMLGYSYTNIAMLPYSITDQWMQTISFLACARNTKLKNKKDGKEYSLWDAYTIVQDELIIEENGKIKKYKKEPKLVLKDVETGQEGSEEDWLILNKNQLRLNKILTDKEKRGEELTTAEINAIYLFEWVPGVEEETGRTTNPDGTPYMILVRRKDPKTGRDMLIDPYVPFDLTQQSRFRTRCRAINNRMHGVYNRGDGGAFLKLAIASMLASMKKYAIGLIDRRFSFTRYDFRTREMRLGSTVTMANILIDCFTAYSSGLDSDVIGFFDSLKFSDGWYIFGTAGKLLYGLTKFFYITLGPSFSKFGVDQYLRKRGYSNNQIANVRRFYMDLAVPLFIELSMSLVAPPDDEEDEDSLYGLLHAYVKKGVNLLLDSWPVEFLEDAAEDTYLALLNASVFDLTVNDKKLLTEKYQNKVVKRRTKDKSMKPFDARGILYYQLYRGLIEQNAYNITSLTSMFQEYKGLTDSALPGTTALMDIYLTISLLASTVSKEDLKEMTVKERKKYHEGREIYQRGDNKNWYKWAKKLLKVTPTRTFEVWFNGYASYESMKWYKEPWSKDKYTEGKFKFQEESFSISRR